MLLSIKIVAWGCQLWTASPVTTSLHHWGLVSWNMAEIDILSTCELWLPFPIFPIQIMKTPMRYNKSLVSHCTGEWFLYMGRVPLPAVSFLFFVLWWEGHFLLRWICCQAFHIYWLLYFWFTTFVFGKWVLKSSVMVLKYRSFSFPAVIHEALFPIFSL